MSLTLHQKKVLGALLALELHYEWQWWARDAIGAVCGGNHYSVIQRRHIRSLIEAGLVQSQASTWTPEMIAEVRCGCAGDTYGLTEAGKVAANDITFRVTEEMRSSIEYCKLHAINWTERALARERDENEDDD